MSTADMSQFDWKEIACVSESEAGAEAQRQQRLEDPDEAEWIYLRNRTGVWVAGRTPRHLELGPESPEERKSGKRRLFGMLLDSFLNFMSW